MIPIWCIVTAKFDDIFEVFGKSYFEKIRYSPLLVVDDGLSKGIKEEFCDFTYIPAPQPFAFCMAINCALGYTHPSDVIVFNDDIYILTEDIDIEMHAIIQRYEEIGILAPISTNVMNRDQHPENRTEEEMKFTRNDIGMGCGTYIPRKVIDEVGFLDIAYRIGVIGREDRDYCEKIKRAGYKFAIAQNCVIDPETGFAYPNILYSNVAKFFFAENYHQATKLVQDIAGGIVVTCPSREDFLNPETRDVLEKYLGGKAGIPTEDRIRAIKLVRELGSAFHAVSTLHAEGSLSAQKLSFYALGEWDRYKTAAKRFAGIPMKEEETHPLYRGLPNMRYLGIDSPTF